MKIGTWYMNKQIMAKVLIVLINTLAISSQAMLDDQKIRINTIMDVYPEKPAQKTTKCIHGYHCFISGYNVPISYTVLDFKNWLKTTPQFKTETMSLYTIDSTSSTKQKKLLNHELLSSIFDGNENKILSPFSLNHLLPIAPCSYKSKSKYPTKVESEQSPIIIKVSQKNIS